MFMKLVSSFTIIFLISHNYDYDGARMAQLVEALHHKKFGRVLENFQVTYSCSPHPIALGST
jgi:hypothetical protein